MTLQRQVDKLPVGRYWVDVFDQPAVGYPRAMSKLAAIQDWFTAFRGTGDVKVLSTQHFDANDGGPARDWYLFEVVKPAAGTVGAMIGAGATWDAKNFGFPTIAADDVKASDDTVQKPDVPQGLEGLGDSLGVSGNQMKMVGAVVVLGLVTLLVLKFKK